MSSDTASKYSHLLKPIRDLTKNWNIDIAGQLEEYLEEIDQIAVTFDGGRTSMNFAEAALLIQGFASVYSKKVEYLYGLVYQVLDLLSSKKKLLQAGSVDAEGNDVDVGKDAHSGEEPFLTLDDVREPGNLLMRNDGDDNEKVQRIIPRTPMALMKLDETEKEENPLLSKKGEVLGNRNDFNINTSHIPPVGMLLLDLSHLSMLELSLCTKPTSTPFHPATRPDAGEGVGIIGDNPAVPEEELPLDLSLSDNDVGVDLDPAGDEPQATMVDEPQAPTVDKMKLREKRKLVTAVPKPVLDPWQMLAPHETNKVEKPFRKGRTFRVPASLVADTKKRKRKKEVPTGPLPPITEFCIQAYYSATSRYPSNSPKAPSFPEFEPLFWVEFNRRQKRMQQFRKKMLQQGRQAELANVEEEGQDVVEDNAEAPPFDGDDGLDDGDFQVPTLRENSHTADPQLVGDELPVVSSYEDLVRHHVDGFLASAVQYAQATELSKCVAEWEEKIKPRLEEEEKRPPFDIHKYGNTVLESFQAQNKNDTSTIPFRRVVRGVPSNEVCRLFLATLQLANNYNIEIASHGILQDGVDTMTIKLLSTKQHFQEIHDYLAPSAKSN